MDGLRLIHRVKAEFSDVRVVATSGSGDDEFRQAVALGTVRAFTRGSRLPIRLLGTLGLALSVLFGGFLGAYVFVLSYRLPPPSDVSTGLAAAPDVELLGTDGRPFRLASLRGTRVVLVFYRGHW